MTNKYFRYKMGKLPYPLFFPDATRGFVKHVDLLDVKQSGTPGVLVNTFHLWQLMDKTFLAKTGGIADFMNWKGAVISDSGGFQIMSLIKKGILSGKITDEGIVFHPAKNKRRVFTPEDSIRFQILMDTDLVVVLDDFTDPASTYQEAKISVDRTLSWALRSKKEFDFLFKRKGVGSGKKPYLIGVVQGGEFMDLRKYCTEELVKIGFDGLGWGGWPFVEGRLNFESAKVIAENAPNNYIKYGLGIGKPQDIVQC